jgi:hypothetical protein
MPPPKPKLDWVPTNVNPVIEELFRYNGLEWLLPTIREIIRLESGDNQYIIAAGSKHYKRVEKLLPQLEAQTGTVWQLNKSPSANELSVGTWQYNLGGGKGQSYFADQGTPIGMPETLDDIQLVEAIYRLSDTVSVTSHVIGELAPKAQYLMGLGLSPQDVAKEVLWPWSTRDKALVTAPPTSFSLDEQITEISLIPNREDYIDAFGQFDSESYIRDVKERADLLAITGEPLPSGADDYFKLNYDAAKILNKDLVPTPEDQERARLELDQLRQSLVAGAQGLRLGEQQYRAGEQALRLGEPVGIEQALRTPSGQQGYKDYWSGRPINSAYQDDTDYMTAYNFAVAEERPDLLAGQAAGMDRIISQIGNTIESRKLRTSQVVEEFNRNIAAFAEGGKQYLGALQYAFQPRGGYIPGREPEGLGQSLGLPNVQAQPYKFDPFQMSLDLLRNTQPITSVGVTEINEVPPNAFNDALAIYNRLLGR